MKIHRDENLAYRTRKLVFSKAERDALRRAAAIAGEARRRIRSEVADFEDDAADLTLAHVEYDAADLADDGEITFDLERRPLR